MNTPNVIYLQVCGECKDNDCEKCNFDDLAEVTWCKDKINDSDAAYKLGFDYVGCELDKEYFVKGCERFDRECRGIIISKSGQRYQQTALF